jgi:hypothetical protein
MALIIDPDLLADSSTDDSSTEVYINTSAKTVKLVANGDLSTDGVTLKCLYSFLKEEWRNDPNSKNLAAFPFPLTPITDESFEFGEGWDFADNTSRYLIRTAGWTVKNVSGNTTQKWAGIIGLGTIESDDQLYFQQATGGAAANVQLTGQINQAVQIYRDDDGDANTAEGSDFNYTGYFKLFVREAAQLYDSASLDDIGVTTMDSIAYRFPISTGTDLKIQANDAIVALSSAISAASWTGGVATIDTTAAHGVANQSFVRITDVVPDGYNVRGIATVTDANSFTIAIASDPGSYTSGGNVHSMYYDIRVRYFDQAFSRDVDSTTERDFGIVIDVGTHSGVDGATTLGGTVLTTAEAGIDTSANLYVGGNLVVHEGNNAGTYVISAANSTAFTINSATWANTLTNLSFTAYPPTAKAIPADAEDIYTKVQYLLRQPSDIDSTDQSVVGKTADELLQFIGDTLKTLYAGNPNAGGNGVFISGFLAADTNRIIFTDNIEEERQFPFVAALTLNFGDNLKNDTSAKYWVYFTTLPGAGNDYGESGALIVDDNDGTDMAGNVGGVSSITHTFNYDGNIQGGRTANSVADITAVAIGLSTGQYVRATGTIGRSVTNSLSLVAALERNYANPA